MGNAIDTMARTRDIAIQGVIFTHWLILGYFGTSLIFQRFLKTAVLRFSVVFAESVFWSF